MNKLRIFFIILVSLVLFIPCFSYADSIPVMGDWTVEYVAESDYTDGDVMAKFILYVTNTSSS